MNIEFEGRRADLSKVDVGSLIHLGDTYWVVFGDPDAPNEYLLLISLLSNEVMYKFESLDDLKRHLSSTYDLKDILTQEEFVLKVKDIRGV